MNKPAAQPPEAEAPEPSWRSDKAHEVICDAAERIANVYCSEDDTYVPEVKRLTVAITDAVDRAPLPRAGQEAGLETGLTVEAGLWNEVVALLESVTKTDRKNQPWLNNVLAKMRVVARAARDGEHE
jgi:hypothetical protein